MSDQYINARGEVVSGSPRGWSGRPREPKEGARNECPKFPNDERCCMCYSPAHTCQACPTFTSPKPRSAHKAPEFGTHVPKAPSMTQAHFQYIADTIAALQIPEPQWLATALAFADALAATNPRFKRDLFLRAAGVE